MYRKFGNEFSTYNWKGTVWAVQKQVTWHQLKEKQISVTSKITKNDRKKDDFDWTDKSRTFAVKY